MENKESKSTELSESTERNKFKLSNFTKGFLLGATVGIVSTLAFLSFRNPTTNTCQPPSKIISLAKAQELYDTYTDRRSAIISPYETMQQALPSPFVPSRCGEYEYDEFKEYTQFLDCIDNELKLNGDSIKSVRLYFATYPDSTHFKNGELVKVMPDGNYKGRNTFMIVPTSQIAGSNQGFLYKLNNPGIEIAPFNTNQTGFHSLILNEAGLRPPPPQGDDFN